MSARRLADGRLQLALRDLGRAAPRGRRPARERGALRAARRVRPRRDRGRGLGAHRLREPGAAAAARAAALARRRRARARRLPPPRRAARGGHGGRRRVAGGPGRRPARDAHAARRRLDRRGGGHGDRGHLPRAARRADPHARGLRRSAGRAADVFRDALTGLTSPLLVPDRLSVAISQAYRHRARVGVVHVDVDGFAAPTRGSAGRWPTACCGPWRAALPLRPPGRHGRPARGTPSCSSCPACTTARTRPASARRCCGRCASPSPSPDGTVPLTASVGIAIFPEDGEDAPALLASAEQSARRARTRRAATASSRARPPPLEEATTRSSSRPASARPSAAAAWT